MDDVALKLKLLRSQLREYVPGAKHSFNNHSELMYVVSTVKTHELLSEWAPQSVGQDLVDAWKSAVDSWVQHLPTLASSNLPAGVSHFVKAASLASLSDLFTRLSAFSNAKKDRTSLAAKVIQPAVNLLNEDSSAVVLVGRSKLSIVHPDKFFPPFDPAALWEFLISMNKVRITLKHFDR